jgi:hypothetical protein
MIKNILSIVLFVIVTVVFSGCAEDGTNSSVDSGDIYQDGVVVSSVYNPPMLETIATFDSTSISSMVIDNNDNIYIALNDTIYKIDSNNTKTIYATDVGVASAMAVDNNHSLYVTDIANFKIYKFTDVNTSTVVADTNTLSSSYIYSISDMAVDAEDNLYIINSNDYRMYKISASGTLSLFSSSLRDYPKGIVIDSNDQIYVNESSYYSSNIKNITNDTYLYSNITSTSFLELDKSDNMYTIYGGTIYKQTSSGSSEVEPIYLSQFTNITKIVFNSYNTLYFLNGNILYKFTKYVEGNIPTQVLLVDTTLSWHSAVGAKGYNIYSSTTDDGNYTQINTDIVTATKYMINDTNLFYKVASVLGDNSSSELSKVALSFFNTSVSLYDIAGDNANWIDVSITEKRSGVINDYELSCIETTINGTGTLTFDWKVSSENGYDYLRFYKNGSELEKITGDVVWTTKTYVNDLLGDNTYKWCYTKDGSTSSGDDYGSIKDVRFVK